VIPLIIGRNGLMLSDPANTFYPKVTSVMTNTVGDWASSWNDEVSGSFGSYLRFRIRPSVTRNSNIFAVAQRVTMHLTPSTLPKVGPWIGGMVCQRVERNAADSPNRELRLRY
jgi:hypothetical protein